MAVLRRDHILLALVAVAVATLLVVAVVALAGQLGGEEAPRDADVPGETVRHTLTVQGTERTYRVYRPAELRDGPVPLVLGLHGVASAGAQFQSGSGLDRVADAEGAIVVYPDGIATEVNGSNIRSWNAGDCCSGAKRQGVDDIAFLEAVIDEVSRSHDIDGTRVFAIGHSNGAMLAYRLACELNDRVTGIGSVNGTIGVRDCAPSQPVSLLHLHGSADTTVPLYGGRGANGRSRVDHRPVREALDTIAAANRCAEEPVSTTADGVRRVEWSGCVEGSAVELKVLEGDGHGYPGFSASDEIFRFLDAHPRPA